MNRRVTRTLLVAVLAIALLDVGVLLRRGPGAAPAPAPTPAVASPDALAEQLAQVAAEVASVRELSFDQVPQATYLTAAELAERAAAFIDAYDDAQADADRRLLRALGAIPESYDIREGLRELLTEQVAGFYDPETGEMVVGVSGTGGRLSPLEELFLAHELEHALADAALGLPERPDDPLAADASFAATALIEGDASLTMQDYLTFSMSPVDQLRVAGQSLGVLGQAEVLNRVPWVLRRSLEFPYIEGLSFVTQLRDLGGWGAVDAAYASPPTNSAAVLFPERYLARLPVAEPRSPGALASTWQRRDTATFGAADLLFLFEAPGNDVGAALDGPRERAAAWAGGTSTLWTRGGDSAVALMLVDKGDDQALCRSLIAWYVAAFPHMFALQGKDGERLAATGPYQDAVLRCRGRDVLLGIGPDIDTARAAIG